MEFSFSLTTVVAFAFALVRTTAFISFVPPFASPLVPWRVKTALAIGISFAITPAFASAATVTTTGSFVIALVSQAFVGFALAFCVWLLMAAVSSAGDLIDIATGFSIASTIDPISARQLGPIGRLYELLVTVLIFTTGAHAIVIRAFTSLPPVMEIDPGAIAQTLLATSVKFFVAALEIAIPMLAVLFLAEVILGLVGKAAPQLNLFVLGLAAKALIALVMLSATVVMLPDATQSLAVQAVRSMLRAFGV